MEINQRTKPPIKAGTKPAISKPFINKETAYISPALITKVKRPKVIMLMGSVRINSTGLIKALTIPSVNATISAVVKVSTLKPGT